jgi:hypothetical protein
MPSYDLLIRGGTLLDGSGSPPDLAGCRGMEIAGMPHLMLDVRGHAHRC